MPRRILRIAGYIVLTLAVQMGAGALSAARVGLEALPAMPLWIAVAMYTWVAVREPAASVVAVGAGCWLVSVLWLLGQEVAPAARWLAELILFVLPVGLALLLAKAWRKLRPA